MRAPLTAGVRPYEMQSSARKYLQELTAIFPAFHEAWNAEANCNRNDDGSFSLAGLWAEFSDYFAALPKAPEPEQLQSLASLVNNSISAGQTDEGASVSACFLENVAGCARANEFKAHLATQALSIIERWEPSK